MSTITPPKKTSLTREQLNQKITDQEARLKELENERDAIPRPIPADREQQAEYKIQKGLIDSCIGHIQTTLTRLKARQLQPASA